MVFLSNVRVTYSGLIALFTSFIGVITGTIFVVTITRNLTPNDFGIWTLIGSLVSYVLVVEPIISYWTTRQISRGEDVGKTAITTSAIFSVGGYTAYIGIAAFVYFTSEIDFLILIIASAFVPLNFLIGSVSAVCHAHRPQALSYATLAFESTKVPLGILLVIFIPLGIIGVLIATIISTGIKLAILIFMVREKLYGELKKEILKFWIKLSWLPLYMSTSGLIHKFDVLIVTTVTGSFIGTAYWGVSIAATSFVGHAVNFSQGLYPKLIATGKKEIAQENLKRTMFFAIPLFAASIVFAKPTLYILNPLYVDGIFIVFFLATRTLLSIPMDIFYNILQAYENIDKDMKSNFSDFIKSKLFLIPTLNHIRSISYIVILIIFLILIRTTEMSEVFVITIWSFIQLLSIIPFLLYSMILVKKNLQIDLPYIQILKYSITALLSSTIVFLIMEQTLTYPTSIWEHLPQVIPLALLGGVIYFGVMYFIDQSTRKFFKSIIKEILKK